MYPIFIVIPENIAGKICFMTEICIYVDMLLIGKLANLMTMFSDLFMCIFFFQRSLCKNVISEQRWEIAGKYVSEPRVPFGKVEVITSKMLLHHDLVDRYGISVSQMTTDMFHLS